MILNTEELATLWHFPALQIQAPLIRKSEARRAEPPTGLPMTFDQPEAGGAAPSTGVAATQEPPEMLPGADMQTSQEPAPVGPPAANEEQDLPVAPRPVAPTRKESSATTPASNQSSNMASSNEAESPQDETPPPNLPV